MPAEGKECWRTATATRAAIVIDAEDYFRLARSAMIAARSHIALIGWDFDESIDLGVSDEAPDAPRQLGAFLLWLVKRTPDLHIRILRWDPGLLKPLGRIHGIVMLLRWMRHPQISVKLDGHHPVGASHHQKIIVIDDCVAFAGGIDMTGGRWDTRAHKDEEPGRRGRWVGRFPPWHDAAAVLEGPAAAALGELVRDRWHRAGGADFPLAARRSDCWPGGLVPQFDDVEVAISRTVPEIDGCDGIHEIEALYVALIAAARRSIYAESQYFASRRIAEAIAARLAEADPPEIVLINPLRAQGWLEPIAMDSARARLFEVLHRADAMGRFRIFHPYTAGGAPIYVHAKVLIVDDCVLRIGSSNMNNRSLRLDTECDVTIDCAVPGNGAAGPAIAAIRDGLLAEHLGVDPAEISRRLADGGSLIAAIEALRGPGRSLRPYQTPDLGEVVKWLADNEALDPEGPSEMFEAFSKRGIFRGRLAHLRQRFRRRP